MILVFNAGSSSLKFSLFDSGRQRLLSGQVGRIGLSRPTLQYRYRGAEESEVLPRPIPDHTSALQTVLYYLAWQGIDLSTITKVGHRVVHGGWLYRQPVRISRSVLTRLDKLSYLAPLHNPINLAVIKASQAVFKRAQHYACFDTGWYEHLPAEDYLYALPRRYADRYHIRKYGFHGLSHEFVARQAAKRLRRPLRSLNLITAHLGSGSSVTAIRKGRAVNTSMGFTPLSGLSMSSRSGDLDANIPLYLIERVRMSPQRVYRLLNQESGWHALCGTADFRQVMVDAGYKIAGFKPRSRQWRELSRLTLRKFVQEVAFYINGYTSLVRPVSAVVFTGAIGAANRDFRNLVKKQLIVKTRVLAIPTDEEYLIAEKIH